MIDVQERMPVILVILSEAISVIAGKRTVIRRIAIHHIPAFNIASVSSKLAQINVARWAFSANLRISFQGNTDFYNSHREC